MQTPTARHCYLVTLSIAFVALVSTAQSQSQAQSQAQSPSLLDDYTPVSLADLREPAENDWLMWRRTANHWGYSPLDQINKNNVDSLRLAWAWTMEPGRQETTPLVHDGVMFLPQACDFIEAVDATDGSPLSAYRGFFGSKPFTKCNQLLITSGQVPINWRLP